MLSNVELSTIAKDNFHYRSKVIIRILTSVYIGLTVITTLLLKYANMNWFDAITHAMSACATCGFSTKNLSIAFFDNPYVELILMGAMVLATIHFGILYATITLRHNNIFRSEVVRIYIIMLTVVTLIIAMSLLYNDTYATLPEALRYSAFQVVSITTTSGFATADTNTWTSLAIVLLIFCSAVCGCAGSTSGGIKVDRIVIAAKTIRNRIKIQQHPNAIIKTKIDGIVQDESILSMVMAFIVAYISFAILGTIVFTIFGSDLLTSFSAAISCLSNVGPGFGEVGVMDNFSTLPGILKFTSTALMLIGRLEIFGFIQLFFITSWR
jgi:trk system potassium uptake protein TrkH